MRPLLCVAVGAAVAAVLLWAARPADAAVGYEAQAVAYWGQVAPGGVELIEDQAYLEARPAAVVGGEGVRWVTPNGLGELTEPERGIVGRRIWVGVFYASSGPAVQCAVFVHEYGHLVGVDHVDDGREQVMTTAAIPAVCAALAPAAPVVVVDPAVVAATNAGVARDEALTRRFMARERRVRCLERAAGRRTSRSRLRARVACRASYRRAVRRG